MHASRWSSLSLLLAQKFQQVKTCFQHLQPKFSSESTISTYQLYAIPSMFIMLFVLSLLLNENDYVIYCIGKSWLKSSRELDAHLTFIAFNKNEPL